MRMQKGLCIELNDENSVFIGQNGEFVHGKPARETAVGEESYFYPKQAAATMKRKSGKPFLAPVLAMLAVAVLFLSVLLPEQEAFAYVQVQVNPGVELGIDETYEVVSIRELNSDGRALIEELGEWEHHSLDEVLEEVVALSMKASTEEIVITTVADDVDQIADEEVVESVMAISAKVVAGNVAVRLKEASKKQWRTSIEKSVPVGQLISDSKKIMNSQLDEQAITDSEEKPAKVSDKQNNSNKAEEKHLKTENETPETPEVNEKAVPPGQEKRQATPAVENGNLNPPGQEKRSEVPGQNKKDTAPGADKAEAVENKDKAKEKVDDKEKATTTAPGQQKKKDEHAEASVKVKEGSSKSTEKKEKPKPALTGPQNVKGKSALDGNKPAANDKTGTNSNNGNGIKGN